MSADDSLPPPRRGAGPRPAPRTRRRAGSKSMHDGVAVWCDCCSCEMEPHWEEWARSLGIEPGSGYETDGD